MIESQTRPAEVAALCAQLHESGAVRVTLEKLWGFWAVAAPRLIGSAEQTAALAAALSELGSRDDIELPRRAWNRSTTPPLPRSVRVPKARTVSRNRRWISYPWCRELGWVSSLPALTDAQFDDLVAINTWLTRRTPDLAAVPMRYRSAEIFGAEKRLESLARTALFGPGRLSLELLACVRRAPPLPAVSVGSGPDVLVVENSDPYWAAVDVLSRERGHPVGAVVWGSGNSFPAQVESLSADVAGRGPVVGNIWYWGDFDPPGLAIAANAAAAASQLDMPAVEPAYRLWESMAERPAQDPGGRTWEGAAGRAWLGEPLWERFGRVRDECGRVAQEAVPPDVISAWATGLCSSPGDRQ